MPFFKNAESYAGDSCKICIRRERDCGGGGCKEDGAKKSLGKRPLALFGAFVHVGLLLKECSREDYYP